MEGTRWEKLSTDVTGRNKEKGEETGSSRLSCKAAGEKREKEE